MCKFETIDNLELLSIDGGKGDVNLFYEIGYIIGKAIEVSAHTPVGTGNYVGILMAK